MKFWNSLIISSLKSLPYGQLKLTMPDKKSYLIKGFKRGPIADLKIKSNSSIKKIIQGGSIAFAEQFISENVTSKNLPTLMYYLALNNDFIEQKFRYNFIFKFFNTLNHFLNSNTKAGSKKNIKFHYDLGNNFYENWLDESMSYSSAIFAQQKSDLNLAQKNKFKHIAEIAKLKEKDNVLEIGSGWGGFIEFAVKNYNCNIIGTTISSAQYHLTKKKIVKSNLEKNATVIMKDYRDLNGTYNKIISIEMFEAVGEKYWKTFFHKIRNLISEDGIIVLQLITISDYAFENYKRNPDFIQKYIFPGGMLPSLKKLREIIELNSLQIKSINSFPEHYAKTLQIWRKNFNRSFHEIQKMGFDKNFQRMWNFYLSYCESGFKTNRLDLKQIKIVPN